MTINLESELKKLKAVEDTEITSSIKHLGLQIPEEKFNNAFSMYGVTKFLSSVSIDALKQGLSIPSGEMDSIRWRSVALFRGYTAFVYMRSNVLERGLDKISCDSPASPFRDFFRAGRARDNTDTVVQHIRNAIGHGEVEVASGRITFTDRQWCASIQAPLFVDELCDQVFRFYELAYQAQQGKSS